jgi:hypothetical protein
MAEQGLRVIVTGLDTDFRGEPFGCMPELIARAEWVDKLHAICMVCGESASRTQRLVDGKPAHYNEPIVVVGAQEMYEARCRAHHEVPKGLTRQVNYARLSLLYWRSFDPRRELKTRIAELGEEISRDYAGKQILAICILRGGVMFLTDLIRHIEPLVAIDFMGVSSYGVGSRRSDGHVRITLDLTTSIR